MNPTFKKYFEIFLVTFIIFFITYIVLYLFYFDGLCNKYSGTNEQNIIVSIKKLSNCKDNFICEASNIETNNKNELNNWSCNKKDIGLIHINIFNAFKESIMK